MEKKNRKLEGQGRISGEKMEQSLVLNGKKGLAGSKKG